MKSIHVFLYLLLSFSLVVLSCKKTDDSNSTSNNNNNTNNNSTTKNCALNMVTKEDSSYSIFTFDLDSNLTKIENYDSTGFPMQKYHFYYNVNTLIKAEFIENGKVLERFEFHYPSGSSTPDSALEYIDMGAGNLEKGASLALSFNSNQLVKSEHIIYLMGNSTTVSKVEYAYTNGNCSRRDFYIIDLNTQQLALEEYSTYEYDDKKNPYYGIGIDFFFAIIENKPPFTKNNINKERNFDANNQQINATSFDYGYEYTLNNDPYEQIKANLSGTEQYVNFFKYDCQ